MSMFERFLSGEDALSRLIHAQPAFTPSAEQEARLFASLRAHPEKVSQELEFEPPASLEENFLHEMHLIQQAQAPRRAAQLTRLQRGESPSSIFGHDLSQQTRNWLAEQQVETNPPPAPEEEETPEKSEWWQWGGMFLVSALVAGLGFQFLYSGRQLPGSEMATASSPAVAAKDIAPEPNVALQLAQDMPMPLTHGKPAVVARQQENAPPGQKMAPPAAPKAPIVAPAPAKPMGSSASAPLQLAAASERIGPEADVADRTRQLEMPAPVPAARIEAQRFATAAPPAAPRMMARKAAPAQLSRNRVILLSEDPVAVARQLAADTDGPTLTLRAANPESPAVLDWVMRLRSALPPQTLLTLLPASDIPADRLILVRP